jgi:hypothetical protein
MKKQTARLGARLKQSYKNNPRLFIIRAAIVAGVTLAFVITRTFPTPDILFIVLLLVAIAFGQTRPFILRFLPFVALLLVYDSFRGIADDLNKNVHVHEMIAFDHWLFGGYLPTTVLQDWWWQGSVSWHDFYFYFLYTIHFAVPFMLAIIIWRMRSALYWQYVWAFVGLSFAAFVTYVIFPAAPPWMAAQNGIIDPIAHISSEIWVAVGINNYSAVYNSLSPNLVAAVPSLHAAYPTLVVLYLIKLFGFKKVWWAMFYPLSVWLGIIYLGEHWVVDVILGAAYALAAFQVSELVFEHWLKRKRQLKAA